MIKFQRIDFFTLIICLILVPLLFETVNFIKITQIGSNIQLYTEEQFRNIRSPVQIADVDQNLTGQILNIPSVIVPANVNGQLDAYALIGLQRELLYNQKLTVEQKNPYVQSTKLFTKSKQRDETYWKSYGQFFRADTYAQGQVKVISQEFIEKNIFGPQSNKKRTCGITDTLDVFLLTHTLQSIWINQQISQLIKDDTTKYEVIQLTNYEITMDQQHVYLAVYGLTSKIQVYLFNAALNIEDGSISWLNRAIINKNIETEERGYVISAKISIEEDDNSDINDLDVLRDYLKTNPHRQHGIQFYIQLTDVYFVLRTQNLIHILNKTTGQEIVSFLHKPNTLLTTNKENQLVLYAIFDGSLFVQHLVGQKMSQVESQLLQNISIVQKNTTSNFTLEEAHFSNYFTDRFSAVAISTKNQIFMFLNNKLVWSRKIDGIEIISIQRISSNQFIVIATSQEICYIFQLAKNRLISYFELKSDKYNAMINQQEYMVKSGIQVARFHPFIDEKSIIIQRGPKIDVLSVKNGDMWNFYVVFGITALTAIISIMIIRTVKQNEKLE